jgi:UDP-glucose 6-dehydrogenase
LRDQGASVIGHDVLALEEVKELEPNLEVSSEVSEVLAGAEVVVALNSESEYSDIDWSSAGSPRQPPFVVDTRGVLDIGALEANEIPFYVLGSTA